MSFLKNVLSFGRIVLAVIVGLFIFFGLWVMMFFIFVGVVLSQLPSKDIRISGGEISVGARDEGPIKEKSVLHLKLSALREKYEEGEDDDLGEALEDLFDIRPERVSQTPSGVLGVAYAIREAAKDPRIEGISMEIGKLRAALAHLQEIQAALKEFKESKKFIYAYSESLNEPSYYLSSFADTMMMPAFSYVEFDGFMINFTFFKGTLDMLGLKARLFRKGKYKSAAAPLIEKSLSEAAREQYSSMLNGLYAQYLEGVSYAKAISIDSLRKLAATLAIVDTEDAKKYGFITHMGYRPDYEQLLRKRLGLKEKQKISLVSVKRYKRSLRKREKSKNTITVILAEGAISNSDSRYTEDISPGNLIPLIKKAAEKEGTKAIILRINSPGGSALGSDKIWHAIREAAKEKPIIASMSSYAASGGYYLAMACDKIVAYPSTITGSIGVFYVLLETKGLLEKIGITEDKIKTTPYADASTLGSTITPMQARIMQRFIDKIYQDFLEKAALGRDLSPEQVHKVAQGRVWIGEEAMKRKLIDVTGNFDEAIKLAATAANIDEYRIEYMQAGPDKRAILRSLIRKLQLYSSLEKLLFPREWLQSSEELQKSFDDPLSVEHIQARLRYYLDIH